MTTLYPRDVRPKPGTKYRNVHSGDIGQLVFYREPETGDRGGGVACLRGDDWRLSLPVEDFWGNWINAAARK